MPIPWELAMLDMIPLEDNEKWLYGSKCDGTRFAYMGGARRIEQAVYNA